MVNATITEVQTVMKYLIIESRSKTHGCEGALVYGVRIINLADINDHAEFDDVSPDVLDVERLIIRLESGGVYPDQLRYIVEDYLEELYCIEGI